MPVLVAYALSWTNAFCLPVPPPRWSPSLCHWLSMMPTRGSRYPRTSTLTSTTSTSALSLRSRVPSPSTPTTAVAHSRLAQVGWSPRTNGRHCHSRLEQAVSTSPSLKFGAEGGHPYITVVHTHWPLPPSGPLFGDLPPP